MSRNENRYGVHRQVRLPRKRRSVPLQGDLEDDGKYYRCSNCGFICNIDRDRLADGDGRAVLDKPDISIGSAMTGDALSTVMYLDDYHVILQTGPDGNPIGRYHHNQYPVVNGGCPLCGTLNWK